MTSPKTTAPALVTFCPSTITSTAVDQMLIDAFGVEKARRKSAFEIALANSSVLSYLQFGRSETISSANIENADEFHAFSEAAAINQHRGHLATNGLLGEKFAVEHGAEHELGGRFSTMDFRWTVMKVLTSSLT